MTYRYFPGNKAAYELKECIGCFSLTWINKDAKYCTTSCARINNSKNTKYSNTLFYDGTNASYERCHQELRKFRGSANYCLLGCSSTRYEWANLTGDYADLNDYVQLCNSCHRRFDKFRVAVIL